MSIIVALFWSLVHSVWQGLALHVVARLVTARSRSAPQRYVLLCSAELGLLLGFVSTLLRELGAAWAAEVIAGPPAGGARIGLPAVMLGSVAAWGETEHYSSLLSQLWSERDADSSPTYQTLQER